MRNYLDIVLEDCEKFLLQNPGEFIILSLKPEYFIFGRKNLFKLWKRELIRRRNIWNKNNFPKISSSKNNVSNTCVEEEVVDENTKVTISSRYWLYNRIPNYKEARGKIILIRKGDWGKIKNEKFRKERCGIVEHYDQDFYMSKPPHHLSYKQQRVSNFIKDMREFIKKNLRLQREETFSSSLQNKNDVDSREEKNDEHEQEHDKNCIHSEKKFCSFEKERNAKNRKNFSVFSDENLLFLDDFFLFFFIISG